MSLWAPPRGLGPHTLPGAGVPLSSPRRARTLVLSWKGIASARSRILKKEVKPSGEGLGEGLEGALLLQVGLAGGAGLLNLKGLESAGGGSGASWGTATRVGIAGGLLGGGEESRIGGLEIEAVGVRLAVRRRAPRGLEVGYIFEKRRRGTRGWGLKGIHSQSSRSRSLIGILLCLE